MVMYRKDLTDAAGVTIADNDSWENVITAAAAMHDPKNGVYGACLRGKPGWATAWRSSRQCKLFGALV
jgi:sorbitol/mannitol transport system substrate-binding protein